jgi:Phage integrase, N-terminal SAM-like domain
MPYMEKRKDGWLWVQRRVPLHLQPILRKQWFRENTRTKDVAEYNRRAPEIIARHTEELKVAQKQYERQKRTPLEKLLELKVEVEALNVRIVQANEHLEGAVMAYKLGVLPKTIPPKSIPVASAFPVEFADIIDLWATERSIRPDTKRSAATHIARLTDFLGHTDMARLTKNDIVQFRGALLKSGKVNERTAANHLMTITTLFNFAVANGKIGSSPVKGVGFELKADPAAESQSVSL